MIASLVVAIAVGLVLLVVLLVGRHAWSRRHRRAQATDKLTKGYSEDNVDAEAEIDLTSASAVTVLPSPHHQPPPQEVGFIPTVASSGLVKCFK